MADRPDIGVTGPDDKYPISWWATRMAVALAGGNAVRLTPDTYREHKKERFRGIIIGGGSDIDPTLYGGEDNGLSKIDKPRDDFEIEMIEHALETHLPIMGICRGAQLINVVLGGNLHPDIRPLRSLTSNRRTPFPSKTAICTDIGKVHASIKTEKWRINSLHHQAVDELGRGLRVVARDMDDFVQAIESDLHPYLVGVQWHPEYLQYIGRQRRLFQRLIDEAMGSRAEVLYS
ncbi:gamma-glutamyl-gamma-aminobutyrate hydrolase family protein [Hahella ganghwensis]|uniref:gamma-glutamyl-gamma-aminobutyrate hydrolase family protein n=1 Tax=Hahella ganghwensis TaxID=286420 RepID=UPI00035EEA8A|nr:gamma-glutamyl-gamma-aminobutyrate hydrolase family protein [Hahella ganghwensis]